MKTTREKDDPRTVTVIFKAVDVMLFNFLW